LNYYDHSVLVPLVIKTGYAIKTIYVRSQTAIFTVLRSLYLDRSLLRPLFISPGGVVL